MKWVMSVIVAAIVFAPLAAATAEEKKPEARMDIVFCIDRSGSMSEVIETAKQKVWGIVNEIALRVEPKPVLRIGLIGYGSADGDIKFFPLTDDLDLVYKNLMTFKVDMGGDEWVGWALMKAHKEMKWADGKTVMKTIFMVGNETAAQGRAEVLYGKTAPEAIKDGIMVNAIYCGRPGADEEKTWREVASLADGTYSVIDLTGGTVTIQTPFDQPMADLNKKINDTYIPYGARGSEGKAEQEKQDANSAAHGGASNSAQRALQKSGGLYRNDAWDLVDASAAKEFKLEEIKAEDLPENMRSMTIDQRRNYIEEKRKEREALQKSAVELAGKQRAHVEAEMKARNLTADSAFDESVRKTVLDQAEKKGFAVKR